MDEEDNQNWEAIEDQIQNELEDRNKQENAEAPDENSKLEAGNQMLDDNLNEGEDKGENQEAASSTRIVNSFASEN